MVQLKCGNDMSNLTLVKNEPNHSVYADSGVDTQEAAAGLENIASRIVQTWPTEGLGKVELDLGKFANVVNMGDGVGLAVCTDGVGSKSIIAQMMDCYDTIGIDCVAMNVNDMICVGAKPISLVDYIAVEHIDAQMLDEIAKGLCDGAKSAGISISGGETAQLKDIVNGFDLVGTAVGRVDLGKILVGQDIKEGDAVIGIRSNGIHSNGLTLARRAFFERGKFGIDDYIADFSCTVGEELLRPTDIYVKEMLEILAKVSGVKALINITSDGLLNLTRVASDVGYVIDQLPEPRPVFSMIQRLAKVDVSEMFAIFNMGVGFCVVVDDSGVENVLSILKSHNRDAQRIGYAVADSDRKVFLPQRELVGQGKVFRHV